MGCNIDSQGIKKKRDGKAGSDHVWVCSSACNFTHGLSAMIENKRAEVFTSSAALHRNELISGEQ